MRMTVPRRRRVRGWRWEGRRRRRMRRRRRDRGPIWRWKGRGSMVGVGEENDGVRGMVRWVAVTEVQRAGDGVAGINALVAVVVWRRERW
ncbi:MAG TPA: hypothetical protein VHP31_11800 [Caproicibacter sp.]|nr:hypothetical protein [Caproicibacter sp.]